MKNKIEINKNTAITLIALVITIVVLIILAAVAINLSLGNNGIFYRAKTAKEQYQNAQEYEQTSVEDSSDEIDSHIDGNRGTVTLTEEEYAQFKTLVANNNKNYSTEEQVIGTWINGKPLYQKVLSFTITGNNTNASYNHGISDIDFIAHCSGLLDRGTDASSVIFPSYESSDYGINIKPSKSSIIYWNRGFQGTIYLTLEYTKTTD